MYRSGSSPCPLSASWSCPSEPPFPGTVSPSENQKPEEIIHDPICKVGKLKKTLDKSSSSQNKCRCKVIRKFRKNLPEQGILSIGRIPPTSISTVKKLANDLAWPVFADIASGLRLGPEFPNRVTYYDQLLIDSDFKIPPSAKGNSSRFCTDIQTLAWRNGKTSCRYPGLD